jgi:hypothetical protein
MLNLRKFNWGRANVAVCVALVAVFTAACSDDSAIPPMQSSPSDRSAVDASRDRPDALSGDMNDWLAAVCEIAPGTQTISPPRFVMPMASGNITRCTSKAAVAGNYYPILAGYYDSEQSADLDLPGATGAPLGAYARGWDPSTQQFVMIALLRSAHPAKALGPLARFGFSLQPNASR